MVAVLHPVQVEQLKRQLGGSTNFVSSVLMDNAMVNGQVMKLYGVPIVEETSGWTVDGNGDYVGGIFSRNAIACGIKWMNKVCVPVYDPLEEGWIINVTSAYQTVEAKDALGCKVISDGTKLS